MLFGTDLVIILGFCKDEYRMELTVERVHTQSWERTLDFEYLNIDNLLHGFCVKTVKNSIPPPTGLQRPFPV